MAQEPRGNFKPGSDKDLAIFGDDINLQIINKLENKIDELNLPNMVDVIKFKAIENQDLKDHINKVGILIYKKTE